METGRADCYVHLNSLGLVLQRDCFFYWLQWQSSHCRSPCRTGVLVDPDKQLPKITVVTDCEFLAGWCSSIASLGVTPLVASSFAAYFNYVSSQFSTLTICCWLILSSDQRGLSCGVQDAVSVHPAADLSLTHCSDLDPVSPCARCSMWPCKSVTSCSWPPGWQQQVWPLHCTAAAGGTPEGGHLWDSVLSSFIPHSHITCHTSPPAVGQKVFGAKGLFALYVPVVFHRDFLWL